MEYKSFRSSSSLVSLRFASFCLVAEQAKGIDHIGELTRIASEQLFSSVDAKGPSSHRAPRPFEHTDAPEASTLAFF